MLLIEGKKQRLLLQKLDLIEKINEKQFVLKKNKTKKKPKQKSNKATQKTPPPSSEKKISSLRLWKRITNSKVLGPIMSPSFKAVMD